MGGKIRKTGIDILGDVPWGTHFCQFYQTKEDLIDILVPYFKPGLENNEFCMWVTSEPLSAKEAKRALREAVPNFNRYLKKGQIEIIPYEECYLKEGTFNLQRVLSGWIDKLDQALEQGYDGLRITGNTAWLEKRDWRSFIEYEKKVNNVIGKYKMLAICSYSLDKCGASEVIDVVSNHQFALIRREGKWKLIESSERKKAEEELEASKRQLQGIIDNSPSVISVKDAKGRYILINREFEKNFGIDSNEKIGKTDFDFLSKEVAEKYRLEDQEVIKTGKAVEREDQLAWKGEIRHFILTKFPLLDSGGQPYAVCVLSTDITDRKWAEEERERILHRLKERYKDLNCLYGIDEISRREGVTIEQFLKEVAQLMPPAWQYPEITGGCISYEDKKYKTRKFKETKWMQRADIIVNNKKAGLVEVCYLEKRHEIDEGPFVKEERNLINAISERLGQIIERKRVEEALQESEEKYRNLFNNAQVGLFRTRVSDGKFIECNDLFAQLGGYNSREELLAKPITAKSFVHQHYIEPNVHNQMLTEIQKSGEVRNFEAQVRRKDGTPFWVSYSARIYPERSYIEGAAIDVSERKRAEEALRESKEKYRDLVENLNDIIYATDKKGVITYISSAIQVLAEYKPSELIGRSFTEFIHEQDLPRIINQFQKVISGRIEPDEYRIMTKSGGVRWVRSSSRPIYKGKHIIGLQGVMIDITERKRAEEEIRSSREQLRNLAAHLQSVREEERKRIAREIHDEVGQSLTALKMDLFWLDKRMPVDQKPLLKKTKSMSKLIDKTVLRIKKISAELRPGLLDYLGLPAAIEWEGEEFQNRTGIKCEVNIDSGDIILDQDHSTALFRIFQETMTNAARHAIATRIKVSLKEKAGNLELRVRDNGKGITENQISDPKSFGLIGMRERAQFLGGKVKIRGVQDKGTTIIATIPLPKKGKT